MSRGASSQSVGRLSPLPPPDLAVPTENGSRTRTDSSISAASDQLLGRSPSRASSRREGMSAVSNEVNGRDSPSRTSQSHRRQASELKPSSPSKELALAPPTVNGLGRSATARERYKERSGSGDSLSTGDARARLSAVEPVRGGAAYERMLLAGTGLTGVGEADEDEEDEDPYGGAVLGDGEAENAPAAAKRQSVARPRNVKLDSAERIRGVAEDGAGTSEIDEEEDTTLLNVEEMLEGFEWRSAGSSGGKALADGTRRTGGRGTADVIEARLLDELQALEAANIHAIIESDDRVALVVKHLDEALAQLDSMDSMMGAFKVQLNARADDISHIESQNRGLQVQTSNQRTLATEIEKLLATIHVDESELTALNRASLESPAGIEQLESAASTLYKSMLQARRDDGGADMAAATERLDEYMQVSAQFCKRLLDYLSMAFRYQADALLSDPARQAAASPPTPYLRDHSPMEDFLGRYCGLLLYMKEIDDKCFARLSAAYFASASELYKTEMQRIFAVYKGQVRKATDEDAEASFVLPAQTAASALRSGTIRRAGMGRGDRTNRDRRGQGEVTGNEAFQRLLSQIMPLVIREQSFIADFLHINDNAVTFADYMDLEPYFRRRAAALFAYSTSGPLREIKGALDLIFGFLAPEWQAFTDLALQRDKM